MKKKMKPSSNDDPKVVYELSRNKEMTVAIDKFNRITLSFSKMNLKLNLIAKKVSLITVTQNS